MIIYAMSDIHGQAKAFEASLALVDFSNPEVMLVLCGDYIDHGWEHPEWFDRIRRLQEMHPGQVVVLKGNHEDA
ncbi:metallophosphoesterase, partial [Adlercreutzia caecimuris]